jgi:hypothetical protein
MVKARNRASGSDSASLTLCKSSTDSRTVSSNSAEELVLAVEVLVEATQRLLRAVDDLLDREVGGSLLVDQRECRIQVRLDALLGT